MAAVSLFLLRLCVAASARLTDSLRSQHLEQKKNRKPHPLRPFGGASTTAVDFFLEKSAIGTTVERRATAAAEPAVAAPVEFMEERIVIEDEEKDDEEEKRG